MTNMKNKFGLLALSVFTITCLAVVFWPSQDTKAQGYYGGASSSSPQYLSINASNAIPGNSATTLAAHINATGGKELCVGFTSQFVSAGVSNITFTLHKSVDNVNFEAAGLTLTWVGNGTNVVTSVTNFSIGAIPYFSVTASNASAAGFDTTNSSLHYWVK